MSLIFSLAKEVLSLAKTISVDQLYLPLDIQNKVDKLNMDLNDAANTLSGETTKSSGEVKRNGDAEGKPKKGQYVGPDTDLAAMLERDLLETTSGVRWDVVAGLSEAKRLLEEAVVLPLWMPNYFQDYWEKHSEVY
ncbi:katanin p60 ATPase-containing subunit A1 [Canna indica]|uniref:Katanin p60 ATPase-containing subunit A1 n=1 Tax=Canna indica TaxID=4628 RepID=A0AAQ3JSG5_9LILI|nr:katanin p60 ATPase-containing subunit A1 [Canna indica]